MTCLKPPRWSWVEQVAVPWGHAVTSTPPSLGLPHVWLTPLRDLQCSLDTPLAGSGMHTCTLTHICTRNVIQISKFLVVSNRDELFRFLAGAGGSTKKMSLEGHQTGGSGHTRLLSFFYQMLAGYLPDAKSRN